MESEGMVHALEAIHRLLRPDGTLVDIRPHAEPSILKVVSGDQTLFAEPKREGDHEGVLDSDRAMDEILDRKMFEVERGRDFEFISYGSTAPELREFWDRYNDYEPTPKEQEQLTFEDKAYAKAEEIRKDSGDDAEVAIHERVRIARLKPVRS
jgi:hypothetical protein